MKMNPTKEIHFSDPQKILSFYRQTPKQGVIHDKSYSEMIGLNKIENDYVIPIEKKMKPLSEILGVNKCSAQVKIIDPNAAMVNQAKENIKNDVIATKQIATVATGNIKPTTKRKSSSSLKPSTAKKPRNKRRETQVISHSDIFGD